MYDKCCEEYALVAQLDRAFGYEPKGREFESLRAYLKGQSMMIVLLFLVLKAFLFSILDDGIVKFGSSPE